MTTRIENLEPTRTAARAWTRWLILAVLLLFSIAAPLNQFKVPPIMPVLMTDLHLSIGAAGLLMSVYAVTGLLLALPSGFIFHKLGFRATGMIAGSTLVLGAALGAVSTGNGALLASRALEGAGTSFMAVLAPAIIAQWFVAEKRGTAMGIWSSWVPLGSALMLIIAPALAQGAGWRAVWWFGAAFAALATALYLVLVRPAPRSGPAPARLPGPSDDAAGVHLGQVLRNRDLWLLSTAFGFYCAAAVGFSSFLPTYLSSVRGMPLARAALIASISTIISIASGPGGGALSDRIGSRKRPYLAGLVASVVLLPIAGLLPLPALVALIVVQGLVIGLVPTNLFSAAVESAGDERHGGLAMAIIMVGQNAGMLVGPALFGALVNSSGWSLAFASVAVLALLSVVAGGLARVR